MIFAVFVLAQKLANGHYRYKYIYITMGVVLYFFLHFSTQAIKAHIFCVGQRDFVILLCQWFFVLNID